jgi:glutathione S-transferase
MHQQVSDVWSERCRTQISSVLAVLEADRARRASDFWFGARIGHADIAVAVVLRFASEVHPDVIVLSDYPALNAHASRHEALPAFRKIVQPFVPPA